MQKQNLTTEIFIRKAKKVHGDRYDYECTNYVSSSEKIEITCKIHGSFFVTPNNHLNKKSGCPKCAIIYKASKRVMPLQEFISCAAKIHKNKYDYSRVAYKNSIEKVEIKCKQHGIFYQTPSKHIFGQGCPKCAKNYKDTTETFIRKSKKIHDNLYDYSITKYVSNDEKVLILCKQHGVFKQSPDVHLSGCGCPTCGKNSISKGEVLFLDYLKIPEKHRQYKIKTIGFTDGFDEKTNTVYEFLGDYWHGNPRRFNSESINEITNESFGTLYNKTFLRFDKLVSRGYTIKYIWEKDWNNWSKNKLTTIPIKTYSPLHGQV